MTTTFTIGTELEEDGRWIAEVMEIPRRDGVRGDA